MAASAGFTSSVAARRVVRLPGGERRAEELIAAEPVTPGQLEEQAGQVMRAERTAPCALPRRPAGNADAVACHRVRRLRPRRIKASTSARRYRGLPASLRSSGNRPRRAQIATADDVTLNRYATCLRVIRSSSMWLSVVAAGAITVI